MERLAEDMVADGYDAVYDADATAIALKLTGVDGIEAMHTNGRYSGTVLTTTWMQLTVLQQMASRVFRASL